MQFIPRTWRIWASDGNRDGAADPHNVFDAALTAGRYLCAGGRDLATADGLRSAVLSYNASEEYLALVVAWFRAYAGSHVTVPNLPIHRNPPRGTPRAESPKQGQTREAPGQGSRPTSPNSSSPKPAPSPSPSASRGGPSPLPVVPFNGFGGSG